MHPWSPSSVPDCTYARSGWGEIGAIGSLSLSSCEWSDGKKGRKKENEVSDTIGPVVLAFAGLDGASRLLGEMGSLVSFCSYVAIPLMRAWRPIRGFVFHAPIN